MSIIDIIRKRRSVRSYQRRKMSHEEIEEIMEAARLAPSARNKQDWKFIIVDDDKKKAELCYAAYNQKFVEEASVVIAGVSLDVDYVMACGVPSGYVNIAIALDHISLVAAEKGIGTCWIGHFKQKEAKEILGVPDEYEIVALMTMGYPAKPLKAEGKNRKLLEEIICYNLFK